MSVAAIALAWRAPLDTAPKLALIALCDHANEKGECWPSMGRLAAMLRLTRSQAQRLVHALIDAGWVDVIGNAAGGRGCTRRYRVALDRLAALPDPTDSEQVPDPERVAPMRRFTDPERVASVREKGRMDAQKGRMDAPKGPHGCDPNHKEPSQNRQRTKSGGAAAPSGEHAEETRMRIDEFPAWVPAGAWIGWVEARRAMRAPLTEAAKRLAVKRLAQLREQGNDPGAVLEQSVLNGWKGLFEVRTRTGTGGRHASRRTAAGDIFGEQQETTGHGERDITAEATRVR